MITRTLPPSASETTMRLSRNVSEKVEMYAYRDPSRLKSEQL
jgi:hypothetical protein